MSAFKFRVTYRTIDKGRAQERSIEFMYKSFARARENYKAILLDFYRKRHPVPFEICLNRSSDPPWENPIFTDRGQTGF